MRDMWKQLYIEIFQQILLACLFKLILYWLNNFLEFRLLIVSAFWNLTYRIFTCQGRNPLSEYSVYMLMICTYNVQNDSLCALNLLDFIVG
jgi:hypothetical protein